MTRNRGTGRTREMVLRLPSSGSIVVVSNGGMIQYLHDMIRSLRPDIFNKTKVICVENIHLQRGRTVPIFVDHFVIENHLILAVDWDFIKAHNERYKPAMRLVKS